MTDTAPGPDAAGLTRRIEIRRHARHRDRLAGLAGHVEAVHGGDAAATAGRVSRCGTAIRAGGHAGTERPIALMRAEHDDHDPARAGIRRPSRDLTLREGVCAGGTGPCAGRAALDRGPGALIRVGSDARVAQVEPR